MSDKPLERKAKVFSLADMKRKLEDIAANEGRIYAIYKSRSAEFSGILLGSISDMHYNVYEIFDEKPIKQVYDGPSLRELAAALVKDLPTAQTPFCIIPYDAFERNFMIYTSEIANERHLHFMGYPSEEENLRLHRHLTREVAKKSEGLKGLFQYYFFVSLYPIETVLKRALKRFVK